MRRSLILAAVVLMLGGVGGGLVVGRASAGDAPPAAPPAPPPPPGKADLPRQAIDLGGGVTFDMVLIPAGEFDMGSPETEEGRQKDETLHRVRITKPYWLATTELTQAVWEAVMGSNPSSTKGPTLPVTGVTLFDCESFFQGLNEKVAGGGFRLPTEAEWEYACRAGSTARYCFGNDEKSLAAYAWYVANSGKALHPVGMLKPNAWGLHDMHGNVWEWCQDEYGDYPSAAATDPVGASGSGIRVSRGGGWGDAARRARSALRSVSSPGIRFVALGFRLAMAVTGDTMPPPAPGNAPPAQPPAPKPGEPAPPAAPPAKEGEVPSWAKVAPEQIEAARKAGVPVAFENSIGMRFVLIPGGTFTMGSPTTEEFHQEKANQHEVTLTRPYYLQTTEVTNGQYRRFKADHDSRSYEGLSLNGDDQPVVHVSWNDATAFVAWLNGQDRGRACRLPTEAEWERACRAGTTGRWSWGEDETATGRHANVADRTAKAKWEREWMLGWLERFGPRFAATDDGEAVTASAGRYLPNAYGLYDMHGNVWEWCQDAYGDYPSAAATDPAGASGSGFRVFRGGSWYDRARDARSPIRGRGDPDARGAYVGFRLAGTVPAK